MVRLDNTRNIVSSNENNACFRSLAICIQVYVDNAANWARTSDAGQGRVEIALKNINLVAKYWNKAD